MRAVHTISPVVPAVIGLAARLTVTVLEATVAVYAVKVTVLPDTTFLLHEVPAFSVNPLNVNFMVPSKTTVVLILYE